MFAAIKERRPWLAALVSFLAGPAFGMLYLNRGLYFVMYSTCVGLFFLAMRLSHGTSLPLLVLLLLALLISFGGVVHSYFIACSRSPSETLRWYAKPLALTMAFVLVSVLPNFMARAMLRAEFHTFINRSASMEPTFAAGDRFLVDKMAYAGEQPHRGDVVTFKAPHDPNVTYVKRVAALPGDRILLIDGIVYVNGTAARRYKIDDYSEYNCAGDDCLIPQFIETLPNSPPHRILQRTGTDEQDNTKFVVVRPGHYYVLGDNRENSLDSRMDEVGLVSAGSIIGKATVKYFDGTTRTVVWQHID